MSIKTNFLLIVMLFTSIKFIECQNIRDYNLEIVCNSRTYNSTQSILEFKWKNPPPTSIGQRIYRKAKNAYSWGAVYRTLNNNDTTFNDTINTGIAYEYRFEKDTGYDGYSIQGYIYAGHRLSPTKKRGTMLLIIDSTHRVYLNNDLRTFRNDLIGDGWFTKVLWVSPSTTVATIKTYIVSEYSASPTEVKSVCLIGDIAVPYSGNFRASGVFPPDGHTTGAPPSHEGAWPCDMYYGDINSSNWTDASVTNNLGARTENNNVPTDGKFDQSNMTTLIELEVGRIDLSNFTSFSETERDLLRRYFNKNHDYKHLNFNTIPRCLIDDNFGLLNYPFPFFDEHFAGNAYRNTAPLIDDDSCANLDYLSTLNTESYQWSYGIGAGSYTNASGVATTGQLASSSQEIKTVFTGLFGSYFGDWDNTNNFLRAPLAARGHTLNSFWVGRPHWFFHHMGLGDQIGYSTLRTQNNYNTSTFNYLYPTTSNSYLQIHTALMGDPSTRQHVVEPSSQFSVRQDSCNNRFILTWTAPTDTAVHDYFIYRARHIDSFFTELGTTQNLTYTDNSPLTGNNVYMLRGMKLQKSGSGSYLNLNQGLFDTIQYFIPTADAGFDTTVCLNQRIRIGSTIFNNLPNCTYNWQSGNYNTNYVEINATVNEIKTLTVTDTLSTCQIKDSVQIAVTNLPNPETISFANNFCNDSLTWSSTLNNSTGHNYLWEFEGGSPNDTIGNLLINPGIVSYLNTGNYNTILTIINTNNQCFIKDTLNFDVACISLNHQDAFLNCENDLIQISISPELQNSFSKFYIQGFINNEWINLNEINWQNNLNVNFKKVVSINDYRLIGENNFGKEVLSTCQNSILKPDIQMFPNPFENQFHLQLNIKTKQNISIEWFNSEGKTLDLPFTIQNNEYIFDTKDLISGFYIITIKINQKIYTYKLSKPIGTSKN